MSTAVFFRENRRCNWHFRTVYLSNADAWEHALDIVRQEIGLGNEDAQCLVKDYTHNLEIPAKLSRSAPYFQKEYIDKEDLDE